MTVAVLSFLSRRKVVTSEVVDT